TPRRRRGTVPFLARRLTMRVPGPTSPKLSTAGRLAVVSALSLLSLAAVLAQQPTSPAPPADDEPVTFQQQPANLQNITGEIWSVAVSPDGKTLAVGSGGLRDSGDLVLWDLTSKKQTEFHKTAKAVRIVMFSPDGKTLATGEFDNTTRLRDPATG